MTNPKEDKLMEILEAYRRYGTLELGRRIETAKEAHAKILELMVMGEGGMPSEDEIQKVIKKQINNHFLSRPDSEWVEFNANPINFIQDLAHAIHTALLAKAKGTGA